jgi:hypothetical protein
MAQLLQYKFFDLRKKTVFSLTAFLCHFSMRVPLIFVVCACQYAEYTVPGAALVSRDKGI